jgi:hypothetical protein
MAWELGDKPRSVGLACRPGVPYQGPYDQANTRPYDTPTRLGAKVLRRPNMFSPTLDHMGHSYDQEPESKGTGTHFFLEVGFLPIVWNFIVNCVDFFGFLPKNKDL